MKSSPFALIASVAVTCVVAAVGLAMTYSVTAPRIAAAEEKARQEALSAVLAGASDFEPVSEQTRADAQVVAGESTIAAAYVGTEAAGRFVGWALMLSSRGYGGPVNMVLGLDGDGKVVGLTILSMNETPGLGTRVKTEPWFLEQFASLPGGYTDKDVKALDMISGATKSSRGVRNSIAAAGAVYRNVLAGTEVGQ